MSVVRYPVVELRQYTLRPGRRDVLIELFDREFVESQEAEGMAIVGQFRDLDDPDRFVWIRGFASMPERAASLASFYGGPAWKAHSAEANATMIDCGNVLLLRPTTARSGFPVRPDRAPAGHTQEVRSRVLVTLYYRSQPFDLAFADFFEGQVCPALAETGAAPLACLQTEHAENTYPALPVRTGENVFAWFARFPSTADLAGHLNHLERSRRWHDEVLPALSALTVGQPQQLRLAPTARSLLR